MKKLYCYVDETGQDKSSTIFVVGIVAVEDKNEAEEWADKIDRLKQSAKWKTTKNKNKTKFLQALVETSFQFWIYVSIQQKTKPDGLKILFWEGMRRILSNFKDKDIFLFIDGEVSIGLRQNIGTFLRRSGISINKITGVDDKKISLIRIIDAVVGAVRDYAEGENEEVVKIIENLIVKNRIVILK